MDNDQALVPPRRGQRHKNKVLPHFNRGCPFQVVEILKDKSYGILNATDSTQNTYYVWTYKNLKCEKYSFHDLRAINIPYPPSIAYESFTATIGGIGTHIRWKVILAKKKHIGECSLFVCNIQSEREFEAFVTNKIKPFGFCNFEFETHENKFTTTIDIPNHKDLTFVAAALHCAGYAAIPISDDMASFGNLGIERYDRSEHTWWNQNQKDAGPLRDTHKWRYGFIPHTWKTLPFTWHSMAANVPCDLDMIDFIPYPLKNYVCDNAIQNLSDDAQIKEWQSKKTKTTCVTSRLTDDQNIQLLLVTYWTLIAPFDPKIVELCSLVQFRYMLNGYVGREVGGYRQQALYIGHGAYCRKFKHKPQYEYKNLETSIQSRVIQENGHILGNGFKGTRGKYGHKEFPEYRPNKKMKRTVEAEVNIREEPYNKFERYAKQSK